jgi:hypothetical protein
MRTIKRWLIVMTGMATVFVATVNVIVNSNTSIKSNLMLQNLEAFTDESSSEAGSGFDCMKKKDDCTFKAAASFQVTILKRMGYTAAEIALGVNLSAGTQIYYQKSLYLPWDERVRCGTDVTCNTYLRQLGLIN